MSLRIEGPDQEPSRFLNGVLAVLNFSLTGMLVYFRLWPMARVFERFQERGTPLPPWLTLGLTLGTFAVAAFLGIRGIKYLRVALRTPPRDDQPQ